LLLHRRLRRRVCRRDARAGLPAVIRAEHLQFRADVRDHLFDSAGGAADLRSGRPAGKVSAALELTPHVYAGLSAAKSGIASRWPWLSLRSTWVTHHITAARRSTRTTRLRSARSRPPLSPWRA